MGAVSGAGRVLVGFTEHGIPIFKKAVDKFSHSDPLRESYRFMRGLSRWIPSETATGQTSMFPAGFGRVAVPRAADPKRVHKLVMAGIKAEAESAKTTTPPFTGGVPHTGGSLKTRVKGLSRGEELAQIARARAGGGRVVPGRVYPSSRFPKPLGPQTRSDSNVDDMFGVPWGK